MQLSYAGGFKESAAQVAAHGEGRARPGVGGGGLRLRRRRASWATWPPAPRPSRSPRASCRSTPARPTLLAMTAAGIDALSDGRCHLGLGALGPQVIEGWHGVPYDKPLGRTREIIDICRQVWAREERLVHDGRQLPPAAARGAGHRPRQAAQDHRPPRAAADPDLGRVARPEERRDDRRGRRGLDAALLPAREGQGRLGRRPRRRGGQARRRRSDRSQVAAGGCRRHRRRRDGHPRHRPARWSRSTSAAWAPRDATSTTTWCAATASSRRPAEIQDLYLDGQQGRGGRTRARRPARGHHPLRPRGLRAGAHRRLRATPASPTSTSRPCPPAT